MVGLSPPRNLTLNSSETAYSFPPHRRRPLQSRTYSILMQILAVCHPDSSQLKSQVDSGDSEPIPVTEKDGSSTHNEANADATVPFPNREDSKNTMVQEDSNNENEENSGFQDGGFDDKQATIPKLNHAKLVTGGEPEIAPSNIISVDDYLVVENVMGDCAIQNANNQENLHSVPDTQMGDFEVDKEFCIDNFNEVFESCFGMDVESPNGQEGLDKDALLENIPKEVEHELQLKEMELEKLLHNSGGVESSIRPSDDEEMEEGEILGEDGVADESFDALSDDVASTEKAHVSEDHFDNSGSNSMKMERRASAGLRQDCLSQNVLHDNLTETQRSGSITPCLENLIPCDRILRENAAENQIASTSENGDCANKNKRKRRGPLTQEKREKKKKSKRLKRAAKNRELGVKRLKLQPVLKEKKIVYCRHYLQGRCHEGDKCKFSHDTIPLTKSKPCVHFARHSCMKGDDCPFDHQLSKYPCTNYASNGFCNRGSDCLFSHEISAKSCSMTPNVSKHDMNSDKGGSDPKSKVTKPEVKFLSPLNNSNANKHVDSLRLLHQKVDAIICSTSISPAKTVPRTGVQPPRGVSFLSNKFKSADDTNNDKRDESSTKTPDGVNIGSKSILKVPSGVSQLNNVSEGAAPRKPRGINFLSFGQPSTNATNLASGLNEKVEGTPLIAPQHVNSLSFNRSRLDDTISKETANFHFNRSDASSSLAKEIESTVDIQGAFRSPSLSFWDQSTGGENADSSSSFKKSLFSITPSLMQKAVQSSLSFAAQLEPDIKVGSSHRQWEKVEGHLDGITNPFQLPDKE